MLKDNKILVGKTKKGEELSILLDKANRHGVITGASGSGKTTTLKVMAESFSDAGVPVFLADVKGDLAGTAFKGETNESLEKRLDSLEIENFEYKSFPVRFWDIFGKRGHSVRTTVKSVGPDILSIMLGLNETQEGNLNIIFKIAEDKNYPLDDIKDLKKMMNYVSKNKEEYIESYGNITTQSIGVIQRALLNLENEGATNFFNRPFLDINNLIQCNNDGKGIINILDSVELFKSPDLYASFLLWFLTMLFNTLPEVGDLEKPKLVFFFDEAHLLFKDMPNFRLKRIVQVVKLIRSRGVGVYFISQTINDIPDDVLAQLGNRVQHTLRAYTPSELKNVKAASDSFRTNPDFDTYEAIQSLGTGEALISFQNEKGEPNIVERATILPPQSRMGSISDSERDECIKKDLYQDPQLEDRESAYELLTEKEKREDSEKETDKKKKEEQKKMKKNPVYKFFKWILNRIKYRLFGKAFNKIWKSIFK